MQYLLVVAAMVAGVWGAQLPPKPFSEEMIAYINNLGTTWKAGQNFENIPKEKRPQYFKKLLGVLPDPEKHRLPVKYIEPLQDMPASFDSRMQWPMCPTVGEIRDQSACGSCWALAAVEAMSDRICIASKGKMMAHISAEDLMTCCHTCGMGCNGGYPMAAWEYWKRDGLVTGGQYGTKEGCQPYALPHCDHHTTGKYSPCSGDSPTPRCEKKCISGYNMTYSQDKHYGSTAYSVNSKMEEIQTEIMTNGPVEAAFTVYADFEAYKGGVYQHKTGGVLGGHAVKILGWGMDGTTPYWNVANSWNEDWGEKGYFRILRGVNECGIEGQLSAGEPKMM